MSNIEIAFVMLGLMLLLIYAGMHVAVALTLLSFIGVWWIKGDPTIASSLLAQAASDAIASHIFGVVPLFVLMGFLVAIADIGRDSFEVANRLFRRVRGGLGIATVAANAVFAAITGISIASAAVFTRVAVPEMLRFGYKPRFAVGVVAGSSVLGMLIPPSLLMILYGFLSEQSVGSLFLAGIIPGILLSLAYSLYIVAASFWAPDYVGGQQSGEAGGPRLSIGEIATKMFPIAGLIFLVLGGIYGGWFTATDGGAVGALGALAIALWRRKLTWRKFWQVLVETGHVTVSVSFLIIAANIFTRMLALSGMPQYLVQAMATAGFGFYGFLAVYIMMVLVLGTIIDSSSIMLIVLPLMLPVAASFGVDLIWFGVITVVAVEIGLLTPPFGLSVYVIKSTLNDPRISLGDIFAGTMPFALIMLLVLLLLIIFPNFSLMLL
ncbi:MAG: TRAP transporter large permease [Smithellaceae bacterium]|nr:TRAP transporter large permease [Smithellaceae bacterium]